VREVIEPSGGERWWQRPPIALRALGAASKRPPIWILCALAPLALALPVGLLWGRWFHDAISHRYAPGTLVAEIEQSFRVDHRIELEALAAAGGALGAGLALVAMVFGAFAAGGWLQVFLEPTHGHSVLQFFLGGARYFWRFVRVLLVTLVFLSLARWLLYGAPWQTVVLDGTLGLEGEDLGRLESEWTAAWVGWIQDGLFASCFALLLIAGVYVRTRMAMQNTQSAVWAWLCSLWMLAAHPVRALRPVLFLALIEAVFLVAVARSGRALDQAIGPSSGPGAVAALLGLNVAVLLARSIARGAHYHAAAEVSRDLVPPHVDPDLWARRSAGAPGGPQYPIGGDEYEVAI
jgi:hypothetical protein